MDLTDRLAWIGYPKGGKLGTDLNRDRLAQALACEGTFRGWEDGRHGRHATG